MGDVTGVQAVANSLTTNVNAEAIWGAIQPFMGFITAMIIVGIGITVFRRVTKKAPKLRTGI